MNLYHCAIVEGSVDTRFEIKQDIHIINSKIETNHFFSRPITNLLKACDSRGKKKTLLLHQETATSIQYLITFYFISQSRLNGYKYIVLQLLILNIEYQHLHSCSCSVKLSFQH